MPPKRRKSASSSAGSKGKSKGKTIQSPAHVENPGHPEDIIPMVLTSATQELFGCRADEDVTRESPYKLLKKDDIIQDIKTRAAVSDFSPVKQIVLNYPEDELLLVFDRDFTYGQSFYLVLTPEAKDTIFSPPEPDTPGVFENEVCKTPEPKPWISLGSEQEIDEESFKETREKLQFTFSRVRRKFGAPVCFSDWSSADATDGNLECASYQDSRFSIKRMQRDCGIQAVPRLQSSSAQTQWKSQVNACTQYTPRELSDDEKEKILQSESLKTYCKSVINRVLQALQQEEIMNVFTDDWKALSAAADEDSGWAGPVPKELVLYQDFTDQQHAKDKVISSISWHPTIYGVLAAALMEKKEDQLNESTTLDIRTSFILFYSFSDPSNPQLLLESPDDIFAFEFCPSDPNIIIGGCMNGQVVLWDISAHVTHLQGAQPGKKASVNTDTFDLGDNKESKAPVVPFCAVSAFESSHKAPITDVQWLPPTFEVNRRGLPVENQHNISVQVVTCSPDCAILFWDVRVSKLLSQPVSARKQNVGQKTSYSAPDTVKHVDRTWKPLFRVSLPRIDTSGEYAPLKFSLPHYTCKEAKRNDDSSEAIPDYSQLRVPSAKTLTALEDVNTQLCVGTEDGEIVYTDWKLEKDDSGRLHSPKPLRCFSIHHWLVNTVQRSPFFKDITLTMGSWNMAILKDGVMEGPIILSPSSEQAYTVGCWSLSRPAVFFIGKEDGSIEVWNLLENSGQPAHVYSRVSDGKITCIKPWTISSKQHFLAVADDLGMVRVFEIPKALYVPSRNESLNMKKFFEVEEERFKDYLKREELWVKQKKEDEELKKRMEPVKPSQVDNEEDDKREYNEYLLRKDRILKSLGL